MRPITRLAITAAALALLVTAASAQPLHTVYLPAVIQPPTATTAVPEPSPSAEPSASPETPSPDFAGCAIVGDPGRAPNYPVAIVTVDKVGETVTLRNVSATTVDLSGWTMCSVTGGQQHPIGGTMAPGETRTFPRGGGGPIWNNSSSDPGALWNAAGQLVSYWPD